MKYDFSKRVNRENRGNIKRILFTPDSVNEAGVVSYAGAEFEFPTAPPVIEAVKEAAENGLFGFTVADDNYRDHIVWWVKNVRGIDIDPGWIVPVQGTIFSVATAIRLFTDPGDAILVITPGYNRYRQAADRLGRETLCSAMVAVVPEIDFADLEEKMARPECRLLVYSNPNNPTGQILRGPALARILDLAAKNHVAVLQDEIFADVVLEEGEQPEPGAEGDAARSGRESRGPAVPMLSVMAAAAYSGNGMTGEGFSGGTAAEDAAPAARPQVISVISLGKTFSFTGVNSAIAIIPDEGLRERFMRQRDADHFGSIDPMAYAALCGGFSPEGKEWLLELREVIRENNRKFTEFFARELPGVKVLKPEATYVLWADFTALGMSGEELHRFLIEEAKFCCDMGDEYSGPDTFVRICTAVPPQEVDRSLEIFREAVRRRKSGE